MKPYGVPRAKDIERPDMGDARYYALKPALHRFPGKSGDTRSNFKDPAKKRAVRRRFAKLARIAAKKECAVFE